MKNRNSQKWLVMHQDRKQKMNRIRTRIEIGVDVDVDVDVGATIHSEQESTADFTSMEIVDSPTSSLPRISTQMANSICGDRLPNHNVRCKGLLPLTTSPSTSTSISTASSALIDASKRWSSDRTMNRRRTTVMMGHQAGDDCPAMCRLPSIRNRVPVRVNSCLNQKLEVLLGIFLIGCCLVPAAMAAFGALPPIDEEAPSIFGQSRSWDSWAADTDPYRQSFSFNLDRGNERNGGVGTAFGGFSIGRHQQSAVSNNLDAFQSLNQLPRSQNFKISPKPCSIGRIEGTCMFVWECIKSEGRHVGMCVDSFMFGSCCAHNYTDNIVLPQAFSYTRPTKPVGISSFNHRPRPPHLPHKPSISGMTTIERPHGAGTLVIRPSGPHHQGSLHRPQQTKPTTTSTTRNPIRHPTTNSILHTHGTGTTPLWTSNSVLSAENDLQPAASVGGAMSSSSSMNIWQATQSSHQQHQHQQHHQQHQHQQQQQQQQQQQHWHMTTEPNFITKPRPPSWEKPQPLRPAKPSKPTKKPIVAIERPTVQQQHQQQQQQQHQQQQQQQHNHLHHHHQQQKPSTAGIVYSTRRPTPPSGQQSHKTKPSKPATPLPSKSPSPPMPSAWTPSTTPTTLRPQNWSGPAGGNSGNIGESVGHHDRPTTLFSTPITTAPTTTTTRRPTHLTTTKYRPTYSPTTTTTTTVINIISGSSSSSINSNSNSPLGESQTNKVTTRRPILSSTSSRPSSGPSTSITSLTVPSALGTLSSSSAGQTRPPPLPSAHNLTTTFESNEISDNWPMLSGGSKGGSNGGIVGSALDVNGMPIVKTISAARSECGVPVLARPETRIVGGKSAAFGRWPWQVSVRRTSFFGFSSTHRCGGALINENWIATAGHCVDDLLISQIRIRVGEYDFSHVQEQLPYIERGVSKKVVHPKYNYFTYEYDLALVKLEQPLEFAPHVSPICLPQTDSLLIGMNATVTGWGRLSEGGTLPSVLQEVSVPIVSNDNCKTMFLRAGRQEIIPEIFLCAGYETGGQDSCQGDSGGPLQVKAQDGRFFLAGIISWGIGCAEANLPGVCTRISKFVPWIMENVT